MVESFEYTRAPEFYIFCMCQMSLSFAYEKLTLVVGSLFQVVAVQAQGQYHEGTCVKVSRAQITKRLESRKID